MEVNNHVISGFEEFDLGPFHDEYMPKYAALSALSQAESALWTNRVPEHEPWPRVMKGDTTPPPNEPNEEYKKNVHHYDQYDNVTSPDGIQPIGRVEGDEKIERNDFWRR